MDRKGRQGKTQSPVDRHLAIHRYAKVFFFF